jgi:hypothetical protein
MPAETHLGNTELDSDLECKAPQTSDIAVYQAGLSVLQKHPLVCFATLLAEIGLGYGLLQKAH